MSFQDVVTLIMCSWCQRSVGMASRPTGFRPAAALQDTRASSASNVQQVSNAGTLRTEPSAPASPAAAEEVAVTLRPETATLLMRRPETEAALRGFTETLGSPRPVRSVPVQRECPALWLLAHWSLGVTTVQPEPPVSQRLRLMTIDLYQDESH